VWLCGVWPLCILGWLLSLVFLFVLYDGIG
jgi:hypothetical protein